MQKCRPISPTGREKNASQSGVDLIEHIGIPQLRITPEGGVSTNSGKPVAIFIDFITASDSDLKAMRMADVKRVEYYENPSDPRLQSNQFVVNYIMAKYEYGGYVKLIDHTTFITPAEQLLGNLANGFAPILNGATDNTNELSGNLTYNHEFGKFGSLMAFVRGSSTARSSSPGRWGSHSTTTAVLIA